MEKRFTYDAEFKRKVILCAEEIGNRAAGKRFMVDEKNVRRWRAMKEKLFQCKKYRKSFSGPKKGRYPAIDAAILTYIKELRSKGLPVTREILMVKAKECAKNSGVMFKASHGWCENFMKREGLALRRTTITEKLPMDYVLWCNSDDQNSSSESEDLESDSTVYQKKILNELDKINIEKSLEIEIEDQESDFQRFPIKDINNVEDKVNSDQRNSTDVSCVTETNEKKEFNANNLNNGNIGREDSPLPSDSISVVSEAVYSASSDDEIPKSVNSQNKQNRKRKTIHKDAIQELIEAEKRSYELQWKKLQIEIEVAKSMKTFFNSMAKMMDRILKPQSSQSSSQTFSQVPQNSNWSFPSPNYYPFPFIPNYSQPMPFPPFFQPFPCNNQNNSQASDTNASTAVNNLTKETKEGNEGNKTT